MLILSLQDPDDSNYILCPEIYSQSPNSSKMAHDSLFLSITKIILLMPGIGSAVQS